MHLLICRNFHMHDCTYEKNQLPHTCEYCNQLCLPTSHWASIVVKDSKRESCQNTLKHFMLTIITIVPPSLGHYTILK